MSGLKRDLAGAVFAQAAERNKARQGLDETIKAQRAKLRARLFGEQLAVLDDPYRFRSVLCARRAGKSYTAAALLVDTCLAKADSSTVYITLTRGSAKRILWAHLHRLSDQLGLGITWNNSELLGIFPNGSRVQLCGAETAADIEKFRGVPFHLAIIDECKSFATHLLDELIEDVLTPCLADTDGHLVLMGTPGAILTGTFYEATGPEAHLVTEKDGERQCNGRPYKLRDDPRYADVSIGWSFHSWELVDNVKNPKAWANALLQKKRSGWADNDPIWLREWLGRWVSDNGAFVLRYDQHKNAYTPNPEWSETNGLDPDHEWQYVLGMDLGYDDDFDIEIFAWAETHPDMFHVEGFNAPRLEVKDIAIKVSELQAKYGEFAAMVGDRGGLGKMILATLDGQYGIHIEAADKQEKRDYIELLNSDLVSQRLWVLAGSNLEQQALTAQWDETGKRVDDSTPDHAIDASLYIWRYCYHHFARHRQVQLAEGSPEYFRAQMLAEMEKFADERKRRKDQDFTDRELEDRKLDDGNPFGTSFEDERWTH